MGAGAASLRKLRTFTAAPCVHHFLDGISTQRATDDDGVSYTHDADPYYKAL